MKKETSVFCFLLDCVLSHRKVSMAGPNHVDALQTPIFSHSSCRLDAAENLLARLWETITTSLTWCYSLFLFFTKGAAVGHCHLEDIRLTGGLMSSLSLTSCRTQAPAMVAELSPGWDPVWPVLPNLSNPSNTALKWHTTVSGIGRLGGFVLKCRESECFFSKSHPRKIIQNFLSNLPKGNINNIYMSFRNSHVICNFYKRSNHF